MKLKRDKKWYETNCVQRATFKAKCKKMGWRFEDFKEVFVEYYHKPGGRREKKYIYTKI